MNQDTDCLACDGKNPVNWLLTRLNPSATIRVCEHDIAQAAVTLLATQLEVDAEWLTAVVNDAITEKNALDDGVEDPLDKDDDARPYMPVDDDEEYPVVLDD
jgi:hypothetical protein